MPQGDTSIKNSSHHASPIDRTHRAVLNMLNALSAPTYDVGILSERGALPGFNHLTPETVLARIPTMKAHNSHGSHIYIRPAGHHQFTVLDDLAPDHLARLSADGYEPCAVVETSPNNYQAWLKHDTEYEPRLSSYIAQTLARRYHGDPNAADWRRFGRLPGFTNCKPKHRMPNGFFPFVLLRAHSGRQYTRAAQFRIEIIRDFQIQEQARHAALAARRTSFSPSKAGAVRYSHLSLQKFRESPRYRERPAAADISFCVAALSLGMPEYEIARALDHNYLSRDPNPARRNAYIQRTIGKARYWARASPLNPQCVPYEDTHGNEQ
ncbi:traI protein (DNA helicase I) (plasmid) [Acidisarcina polymorpha]|uniref:TraI protein (DNA helicase I) n=1 Tax=Acidisarcina polymorpha TaxID=2211140 RepID=A0A2Z5GCI9_9BACT|nr:RepB family DNA primase [Acidisarcina polymorpha]AXC16444.1 traI protein (DNA helicase I) [Acidisarcina polymorpha]